MRIDQLLYKTGYGSRKKIKQLIRSKQVCVEHEITLNESLNVDPYFQDVLVRGKKVLYCPHVYYMLHKPVGVVSAVSDKKNQTVIDLIHPDDRISGLFPVGRLDKDTEGLLLITNNGQLAHQLLAPNKKVLKRYEATINDIVTKADQDAFTAGVVFHGGVKCKPAQLTILSHTNTESKVTLDISEGKFHQVKKMFLAIGKKVTYLKRTAIGPLELDNTIPAGSYRPLSIEELDQLKLYFI